MKELVEPDGTFRGHALNVKVKAGSGKDTWLYFEGFTRDNYGATFYGVAHETCHPCHSDGTDYVQSPLP